MSSVKGTTKNLSEGRVQALQAILSSVSPDDAKVSEPKESKITEEQVRRISNKLGEIFGEDPQIVDDGTRRNEKGELVNEEGLPIIDINEPESNTVDVGFRLTGSFDDPDVLPQWTLSPEENARRKAERERILDLLEAEERAEEEREELSERERFVADLERRKQAANADLDSLKKAKELQKKMGRALVRNVIESKENKQKEKARGLKDAEEARAVEDAVNPLKSKKSVTFAVSPEDVSGEDHEMDQAADWGDVIPARLNKGKTPVWSSKQTMKMDVIERHPGGLRSPLPPNPVIQGGDSDDESVSDVDETDGAEILGAVTDSDIIMEDRESGPIHESDSDSQSSNGFMDDAEPTSDWDEEQLVFTRHQREVALAYYEKRKTFGAEVASAMRAHTHEEGENEWDQPIVPLEATLASAPPKPLISKFKVSLASPKTNTLPSHSLGPYVIPSSHSSVLSRAVRYGKLQDGQLVGGEGGESEDETEGPIPTEQEILEMLTRGEVTNVGPQLSLTEPMSGSSMKTSRSPALSLPIPENPNIRLQTKTMLPPNSRDSPLSDHGTVYSSTNSSLSTPVAVVERSSPKLATPTSSDTMAGPALPPSFRKQSMHPRIGTRQPQLVSRSMPGMLIESPSFRNAQNSGTNTISSFSSVVESLSFSSSGPPTTNPPFQSAVIESSSQVVAAALQNGPSVVMSAEVKETGSASRTQGTAAKGNERKKVSRFLSERS